MERSSSELKQYLGSEAASSNDDETLAKSPSERNNHKCTGEKGMGAFASRSYKS